MLPRYQNVGAWARANRKSGARRWDPVVDDSGLPISRPQPNRAVAEKERLARLERHKNVIARLGLPIK